MNRNWTKIVEACGDRHMDGNELERAFCGVDDRLMSLSTFLRRNEVLMGLEWF